MIAHFSRAVRLLPFTAVFAVSGCFATRNDVRVVQSDLASFRTEQLKANADQREALAVAMRTLGVASDSVRAMNNRLTSLQGDVKGGLRNIDTQLIEIQALLKQSATRLEQLRKDAEIRQNQASMNPTMPMSSVPDSIRFATAPSAPVTGPRELYANGRSQFTKGSWSTAREIFQELIATYPTSELAPNAQLSIGQTFEGEKNLVAAEQTYAAVFQKYPDSPQAPTSLYKRALIFHGQDKDAQAKPLLLLIVSRYKSSDEYPFADELLKTMK